MTGSLKTCQIADLIITVYTSGSFVDIPYSGKVWWGESLANWGSRSFGEGKFGEY